MMVSYYVTESNSLIRVQAAFRPANTSDYMRTNIEHWQTDWNSDFIQQPELEKYAFETLDGKELLGLGAYRNMPEGVLVYIEYIESAPHSNPTLNLKRKYRGIGAALIAFGVQLSIDYGYGGTIYLKAKTSDIRNHYIQDFGAIPFSRIDPFMLLIDGDAANALLSQYLKEEE